MFLTAVIAHITIIPTTTIVVVQITGAIILLLTTTRHTTTRITMATTLILPDIDLDLTGESSSSF